MSLDKINLISIKERIAISEAFNHEERMFVLWAINAAAGEVEWSCSHVAGAACAECYRLLAAKAHEVQAEVDTLRDIIRQQGDFR